MPTTTLLEAAKTIQDDLIQVVAEDIFTTNPIFRILPFTSFTGQAIIVPREQTLGDAGVYGVGDTITHKNPPVTDEVIFRPIKIIGDVELDKLVQATSANAGFNRLNFEIASKAKSIARRFQSGMAQDDGVSPNMFSLPSLTDSGQFTTASPGQDLSFDLLNELVDLVKSKDGGVDWIQASGTQFRKYLSLVMAVGGTTPQWVIDQFGTRGVAEYNGVPVFQNDYLSIAETPNGGALTGGTFSSIYAGVWDDGSQTVGVAGIYPEGTDVGINVESGGILNDRDEDLVRVKQYTNFASFNRRGLARLTSLNP